MFAEVFSAGVEELADPEERVVLASAVPEELFLDPSSYLVHRAVGEAYDVERIGDRTYAYSRNLVHIIRRRLGDAVTITGRYRIGFRLEVKR